MSPSCPF
jgi:nucleoside-diphosphate-sugar epimerase